MAIRHGSLPFNEQIDFFRDKVRLPTRAWTDLWEGQHSRAFVVAGAMRDELLGDLQESVDRAISEGTTLEQFRREFDEIVQRHGWQYKGGRNWRTRVIYETNLLTSYQAGRYQQMQSIKRRRPWWRYRHNDSVENPRPVHQAWDGLVLAADDAWWDTHFPPNGWGCRCFVQTLSQRDLEGLGRDGPDTPPETRTREVTVGQRGPSPRTVEVPEGIDPGWAYNPGQAAWGRKTGEALTHRARAEGWEALDARGPGAFRAAAELPVRTLAQTPAAPAADAAGLRQTLQAAIGADQVELLDPRQARVVVGDYLVDAQLARGLDGTDALWPLIPALIQQPEEVWVQFTRHADSGQVGIFQRYLVRAELDGGPRDLVGTTINGYWVDLREADDGLASARTGLLAWSR